MVLILCFLALLKVLLLDEITVDLDVLARADLMTFLKSECDERGATIIYATHIFDGLESWPTHIVRSSSHLPPVVASEIPVLAFIIRLLNIFISFSFL